ncbi:hypothetical protein Dimus_024653 [Dionaea muscipula]
MVPLHLNEQVRGVRPTPLIEMSNLFNSYRLMICSGLVSFFIHMIVGLCSFYPNKINLFFLFQDPNLNNLVGCTTFFLKSTRAMLCLVLNCDWLVFSFILGSVTYLLFYLYTLLLNYYVAHRKLLIF